MAAGSVAAQSQQTGQAPRILASNGAVIEMPEIGALDCAGVEEVLRRIDLADYRGGGLVPPDHPDRPIFDYEDRLARRYYTDCVLRGHGLSDPAEAFSFGFEQQ